jgi:hypothetical protein
MKEGAIVGFYTSLYPCVFTVCQSSGTVLCVLGVYNYSDAVCVASFYPGYLITETLVRLDTDVPLYSVYNYFSRAPRNFKGSCCHPPRHFCRATI